MPGFLNPVVYTILGTMPTNIFNLSVTGKILKEDFGFTHWNYVWTEEFGKLSRKNSQSAILYSLRACVINGIVYGDTNFTALSVNSDIPELTYELFNNYSNPFNPGTKIKYSIPLNVKRETLNVSLKVYDVLGREIVTLVNEESATGGAGSYEVEFSAEGLTSGISAKGGYVSGVYFYQLRAGSFIETKKMVLMK